MKDIPGIDHRLQPCCTFAWADRRVV
jgi:hypothetical protein